MPEHHPHKGSVCCAPKESTSWNNLFNKSFNEVVTCVFTCMYTNINTALQRAIYATICNAISLYTNNVHMAVLPALRFTDIIDAESQNCSDSLTCSFVWCNIQCNRGLVMPILCTCLAVLLHWSSSQSSCCKTEGPGAENRDKGTGSQDARLFITISLLTL